MTNQPGANSWPITGATFMLMYKHPSNPKQAKAVLKFLDWSYSNGVKAAKELDYVPIPESVVDMIKATWHSEMTANGQAVW